MSDWEDELDDVEKKEEESKEQVAKGNFDDESEEIIKKKIEPKPAPPKEAQNKGEDYEKKYQEMHKDQIKADSEIDKAVAGIKDDELRLKKKLELQNLRRAEKFLGKDENTDSLVLNLEKDFITLAQKNASRINEAKKPSAFTFSYLKNSIELLGPQLDSERLNDLLKCITVIFNKKLKEENADDKKKTKKPKLNAGKINERNEKRGIMVDFAGADDEEEEYDDDDFM
jgi:hypothetical protein